MFTEQPREALALMLCDSLSGIHGGVTDAGSELVIGPWSHSGFLDNRVGHVRSGRRSRFNHLTHAVSFFDRCCGHTTDAETMAELAGADATDSTKGANRLPACPQVICLALYALQGFSQQSAASAPMPLSSLLNWRMLTLSKVRTLCICLG